jgi:CheY-like chemotaxis protein
MPYAPSAELSGIRVLVVDDDQDTLEMLELVLRQAGADVRVADSAGAGFRTFREWHPHVVVSDIGMPGEDGYAFINKVRRLPREDGGPTPAIALTAYARSEDRVRVLRPASRCTSPSRSSRPSWWRRSRRSAAGPGRRTDAAIESG